MRRAGCLSGDASAYLRGKYASIAVKLQSLPHPACDFRGCAIGDRRALVLLLTVCAVRSTRRNRASVLRQWGYHFHSAPGSRYLAGGAPNSLGKGILPFSTPSPPGAE